MDRLPFLSADDVAARLSFAGAVEALEAALRDGLDVEADTPRSSVPLGGGGELLVMPSAAGGGAAAAVKLVTVGGEPRIQGVCVVFDAETLAPAAVIDGVALTSLRTAAVSALAARRLAAPGARRLLVLGRGPQGRAHADAIRAVVPTIDHGDVVGRADAPPIETYDIICCCTTAREPLFDGARVADDALVIAIGSHEPDARELDTALMRRASVVVESRASALREAGDVLLAGLGAADLHTLAEPAPPPDGRPRVFKSTGMAWEDAVVAAALLRAGGSGH